MKPDMAAALKATEAAGEDDLPMVHRCPSCGQLFDSPSVCVTDGAQTEPMGDPRCVCTARMAAFGHRNDCPFHKDR